MNRVWVEPVTITNRRRAFPADTHGGRPLPPAGKDRMHDENTVQRFIELRATGWTYARLIAELNVSKPTLIAWSRKHQFDIQNLKAIELEALRERWLASTTERVNGLGGQLKQVEAALATRDLAALSTPQLFALSRSLRRQIEQAVISRVKITHHFAGQNHPPLRRRIHSG